MYELACRWEARIQTFVEYSGPDVHSDSIHFRELVSQHKGCV